MRLTAEDIARVRIADTPDFGDELVVGGYVLAHRIRTGRLARWQLEVARHWDPEMAVLFDFYTPAILPGFLSPLVPSFVADDSSTAEYLRVLARSRPLTPFTKALADGRRPAQELLGRALTGFQSVAIAPYRGQIRNQVAAAAGKAAARAAASGVGALLRTLHPGVRWDDMVLSIDAFTDSELELNGRALVLRPSVLAARPGLTANTESVVLSFPAAGSVLGADPPGTGNPSPALSALLGTSRAAALLAITHDPDITTGQLAAALHLSPSVASRHTGVLRAAGLIDSVRDGMVVRHHPTRLGIELAANCRDPGTRTASRRI